MHKEVIMPKIGQGSEEGSVREWFKKVGDYVEAGELLIEIEADKISTEIEAAVGGTLVKILAEQGETVAVGTTIAWIDTDD